jgi:hypothetical protein
MTNQRLVLAAPLAAGALVVLVATISVGGALRAGLAPWPGIVFIAMAAAAFVLSGKQESFLVAGLLAASGVVGVMYGLVQTEFLAAATFPGPVFGVIIGLPVLGLGVAKVVLDLRRRRRRSLTVSLRDRWG